MYLATPEQITAIKALDDGVLYVGAIIITDQGLLIKKLGINGLEAVY